ncbi:hypothetical protein EVAR_29533_1 [Eumeta japonica]|uniref:Uncharacterized protein n=1 Tax=Eumeta variegata TaxID=151549 RepID=A0A4C1WGF5_EUMVA|nr:hypothetical protein EVAR_29533_1 [Eumeta japonica]
MGTGNGYTSSARLALCSMRARCRVAAPGTVTKAPTGRGSLSRKSLNCGIRACATRSVRPLHPQKASPREHKPPPLTVTCRRRLAFLNASLDFVCKPVE